MKYLEKTVQSIDIESRIDNESLDILKVISYYTKSLDLLDDYDHHSFKKINGTKIELVLNMLNNKEI